MKNKITLPAVIILAALLVAGTIIGVGYFKKENAAQQEKAAALKEQQENEKTLLQKQLEQQALDAKSQGTTLDELKQQVVDLKNRPPEIRTETKTVVIENKDTMADIVSEWSPRVVYIECTWTYDTGRIYARASGSATLINYRNMGIRAVTNKHVLLVQGEYTPRDCQVVLPGVTRYSIVYNNTNIDTISIDRTEDAATLRLTPDSILNNITSKNTKLCSSVNIGDKLLVLGYPAIGSQTGLTVTEGIVSGYDGNYYITSAKIDHGNSGGAAILVKDDCYLGIPSASQVGEIESLGRILKASFVISH